MLDGFADWETLLRVLQFYMAKQSVQSVAKNSSPPLTAEIWYNVWRLKGDERQ